MSRFFNPSLSNLEPYMPGEQPQGQTFIKLNTNESPFSPSPLAVKAAAHEAARMNLYSDPACRDLLAMLADQLGVGSDQVFASNGSDEVLAFCFQGLCPNGAAFADLTYGFYPVFAQLYGIDAQVIPLRDDFSIDIAGYGAGNHTVFLANPNAPTGLALPRDAIALLLRANPNRLIVVDEAYVAFGAERALPLLSQYDNLLIIGTFSKSHGLAGARLGYAIGSKTVIEDLNRIKFSFNPYNVNRMTLAAGIGALQDQLYFEQCRQKIIAVRGRAIAALRNLGFVCTDSKANFIFATHPNHNANMLYLTLRENGILVRWLDVPRAKDYLRITVGTDAQMETLIAVLTDIIQ